MSIAWRLQIKFSRRFIAVFTRVRHCSLSWARRIQSTNKSYFL